MIIGSGICRVYRYFDQRWRVCLSKIEEGSIFGEPQVLFNSDPVQSYEAQNYCTLGQIEYDKMNEFFLDQPRIKESMIESIIKNPYDEDRESFVEICKKNIHFLEKVPEGLIRQLYYSCRHLFFIQDEVLFEVGTKCDCLYIIKSGQVDI